MEKLPVIDFGIYGLHKKEELEVNEDSLKGLGSQLKEAFSTVGFCYLKNHGINEALLSNFKETTHQFFEKSDEEKKKYIGPNLRSGYIANQTQFLSSERPVDLRESFGYCESDMSPELWPPVPALQTATLNLFGECTTLCRRICDVLSVGLGLPMNFLRDCHKLIGRDENPTTMRSLYYPPISPNTVIKPNQVRCGEHSDFGTFSLLFQDDVEGLEILIRNSGYVPVTPIPGTVLVFIGDLMQRWSADSLMAIKHRVVIPEKESEKRRLRHTVAFFVHPDDQVVIKCLDGSNKYEPISSIDYVNYRLDITRPY